MAADRRLNVVTRPALTGDVADICDVLAEAFEPFRDAYTRHAYDDTVLTADEVTRRIDDAAVEVLVATCGQVIVGTVTAEPKGEHRLYMRSMAVRPGHQGKGIGRALLEAVERKARHRASTAITLECYAALESAIALYEKSGFRRTGREHDYGGITVFEMEKIL